MPASGAAEQLAAIRALVRRYDNRPAVPAVIAFLGKLDAIVSKQARNEARTWPDWRTAEPGRAIEHDRSVEPSATFGGDRG